MIQQDAQVNENLAKNQEKRGPGRPPKQEGENKEKKEKPKKPEKGQLYDDIAQLYKKSTMGILMHRSGRAFPWPPSAGKIKSLETREGHQRLYREYSTNEYRPMGIESLAVEIVRYCSEKISHIPEYAFTLSEARACAAKVVALLPPLDERPKLTLFKSDLGLCLNRLDFDPVDGPCPDWDEFLSRTDHAEAFKAFVWSIFVPEADRSQILWLWGPSGGAGKTTVMQIILDVLGEAAICQTSVPWEHFSRFWAVPYEHARLVVYTDCASSIDIGHPIILAITGNEHIQVEGKGQNPYMVKMFCKLCGTSNSPIDKRLTSANIRRIIQCEVKARVGIDEGQDWPKRLRAQLPAFLAKCRESFTRDCPNPSRPIPTSAEHLDNLKSSLGVDDAIFESWFHHCIVIDATAKTHGVQISDSIRNYLGDQWLSRTLKWLRTINDGAYRCKPINEKGKKTYKGYEGIRVKNIPGIG